MAIVLRRQGSTDVTLLREAFAALELPEAQRRQLESRYIEYVAWLERNASGSRRWHYAFRLTAIVGSVLVTSMSSAEVLGSPSRAISWTLLATRLAVGVAISVDGFLNLGERWRHYRGAVERLKSEGWTFIQRAAPYDQASDVEVVHAFATAVENLIRDENSEYITGPARPAIGAPTTS
jgi:hypothetical protein